MDNFQKRHFVSFCCCFNIFYQSYQVNRITFYAFFPAFYEKSGLLSKNRTESGPICPKKSGSGPKSGPKWRHWVPANLYTRAWEYSFQ